MKLEAGDDNTRTEGLVRELGESHKSEWRRPTLMDIPHLLKRIEKLETENERPQ